MGRGFPLYSPACSAAAATVAADPPGLLGFAERSKAMTEVAQQTGSDQTALRPFQVNVPEAALVPFAADQSVFCI